MVVSFERNSRGYAQGALYKAPWYNLNLGPDAKSRTHMTLYTSSDSGASWSKLIQVDAGPGAYSSLASMNATHVGLAYEGFLKDTQRAAGLQYVVVSLVG